MTQRFRGVVLSGGGARGAYGAGALFGLREMEKIEMARPDASGELVSHFYVGTSVGALNATMAAQEDLDELANIYLHEVTKKQLLGASTAKVSGSKMWWKGGMDPFSYYANSGLRTLIEKHVRFAKTDGAHLLITATRYQNGELSTFFRSALVETFLRSEESLDPDNRVLLNYAPLRNQAELRDALLASAAIPFFFPQVDIGKVSYVDGGVGNNTPTRQAARFVRFLKRFGAGTSDFTVCVVQDPVSFVIPSQLKKDLSNIVQRTLDIFGHTLTEQTLEAWARINREVELSTQRAQELQQAVDTDATIPMAAKNRLRAKLSGLFNLTSSVAPRVHQRLLVVRPSVSLESDGALDFDTAKSAMFMKQGYEDFLGVAEHAGLITASERNRLSAKTDLPFI